MRSSSPPRSDTVVRIEVGHNGEADENWWLASTSRNFSFKREGLGYEADAISSRPPIALHTSRGTNPNLYR